MSRVLHAQHRGAATDTAVINGISAGGLMAANIDAGYGEIVTGPHDGRGMPATDRFAQYVRGSIACQDWDTVLDILGGTVGTYVFYENEAGADTYTSHTITAPVIHNASVEITAKGRATATFGFECRAGTGTATVTSMWAQVTGTSATEAIDYSPAVNITAAKHKKLTGSSISHVLGVSFNVAGDLSLASGDTDEGYTAVDVVWGGTPITGSLTVQDSGTMLALLECAKGDLEVTVQQASCNTSKTLTLVNCMFTGLSAAHSSGPGYRGYTLDFVLDPGPTTPHGYNTNKPFTGDTAMITIA